MLRHIQRGRLQGHMLVVCTSRHTTPKVLPLKINPSFGVFSLQTSSFSSAQVLGKDVYQESYARRIKEKQQQSMVPGDNPFAMPFAFIKAFACGLGLATVVSVILGCNNSKFRAKLQTTFPYAALWVDMIKGEEDIEKEQKSGESQADESPFQTDLRAGMLEVLEVKKE